MNRLIIISIFALIVSGCATAKQTYTSDGQQGLLIECGGSALTWGACYEKAGSLCKEKGYTILEKIGDKGIAVGMYGGGSVITRTMIIQCKE